MTGAPTATLRPVADVSLRDLRDVDPYPAYERMRAVGNVVWDEGMAAWLVLDTAAWTAEWRRAPYDVAGAQKAIRAARLPDSLAERLQYGQ